MVKSPDVLRWLIDGLFLLLAFALPVLWLLGSVSFGSASVPWHAYYLLAPAVLLAARAVVPGRGLLGRPAVQKALLAYVVLVAPFLALELVLKATGFQADLPPIVVKADAYGGRKPKGMGMVSHPEYRWIFKAGGTSMDHPINSMGFREREVDPVKRPGVRRVICMGDSTTAQGEPPYSTLLHARLTNDPPTDETWEAFNAAVIGFSSSQGLRLFQNKIKQLKPDFVTVYFGWNDHWWSGIFQPDSVVMARASGRWTHLVDEVLRKKRFYQFIRYHAMPVRNRSLLHASDRKDSLRVPPEEYLWNLDQFIREIRAIGAVPLLVTAPRAPALAPHLVERGNITSIEDGQRLHDAYAQYTRDAAAKQQAPLLDLHQLMRGPAYDALYAGDGIHFTQDGLAVVAEELDKKLRELAQPELAGGRAKGTPSP